MKYVTMATVKSQKYPPGLGRCLFKLFLHPSLSINKGAGLLMKAIIEEGSPETAFKMQELALAEGALLRHLRTGLVTPATDSRQVSYPGNRQ